VDEIGGAVQRIENHCLGYHALVCQPDRNGILGQTVDEIGGAVQRIDNPLVFGFGAGAGQAGLLC
jgi:hypothetical protein